MVIISQPKTPAWLKPLMAKYQKYKTKGLLLIVIAAIAFTIFKPQKMADIWLTRDQQGIILFKLGYFQDASNRFNNTRWQAFSLYGAEEFDNSAILYGQFNEVNALFAKANAIAHAQRYVKARDLYDAILIKYPEHEGAAHNRAILHEIIENNNRMSESQKPEEGDSPKDLDDDPQRGEGAEKKEAPKAQVKQLSAEELLRDKSLNEMWLRQVQKDPGRFLSQKFLMQLNNQSEQPPAQQPSSN